MIHPPILEVIQRNTDRWLDCTGLPEMTLLRLALLRNCIQELHSEKSRCLATGLKKEVQEIKVWETQIEDLREGSCLQGDMIELCQKPSGIQKRKRVIPEGIFQVIDREKLTRYDRKWEAELVAEAAHLGWSFWTLEAWIEIERVEEWGKGLSGYLWPHGLVLFAESAESNRSPDSYQNSNYWRGRWYIALHSKFKDPHEISVHIPQLPGSAGKAPSPIRWKQIYP